MKLKYLLTISLAVLLSACTHQNNDVPIQSNGDGYDNYHYHQNPPIDNSAITNTEALALGAIGVGTGYVLGKSANKQRYNKPSKNYSKPVVVVNKRYYQSSGSRTKYKSTYRKRK